MRGIFSSSNFDERKALNAVLYIAQSINDPGMHHVAKILYFAEREHLSKFGRPIVGDDYIAMKFGPVPSKIYDIFKSLRGEKRYPDEAISRFKNFFEIRDNSKIMPLGEVNLDVFSDSELDAIEKSIDENKDLDFENRSNKSHDSAWKATTLNRPIDKENIAKAGGANDAMVAYMHERDSYKSYQPRI